jgi:probable F420-dependent oxidoreductase
MTRCGVLLPSFDPFRTGEPFPVVRASRLAEQLDFDVVWVGDHLACPAPGLDATVSLTAAAAVTERIGLGFSVMLLGLRPAAWTAKQLISIDALSGGRLRLGVGVGGEFPAEFQALGVPLSERGARTDESMEVLRLLWKGGRVSHHGRFFSFDDIELQPVALGRDEPHRMQAGGPPLLVSGRKEAAMRRAARLGDGWMPYLMSARAYERSVRTIREEAEAVGRDLAGFEWMMYLYTSIRKDGDRARHDVSAFLGRSYGERPREMLDRIAPAGTPEEVAGRLQEYVDAGVRHFIISPATPDDTFEVVKLAAEEVLPRLTLPGAG